MTSYKYAYGPVPSRRLGRSLGINNIPPKTCTYSCVYCQLGRTHNLVSKRREFYTPLEIMVQVKQHVKDAQDRGDKIDYLTIVPDGEPTLDIELNNLIDLIKSLGINIAVIQNSSLMGMESVRKSLLKADWVSLKVDSSIQDTWTKIDRPHGRLKFKEILEGMKKFAENYSGELVTETMLVKGLNDNAENLTHTANYISQLNPANAYIAIPTRPPAERWVKPPDEETLNMAYQIFKEKIENVEFLIGYEGNAFSSTGDFEEDLLSITAVHPMRHEAVKMLLNKNRLNWSTVTQLIEQKKILELEYLGHKFYMRKLSTRKSLQ